MNHHQQHQQEDQGESDTVPIDDFVAVDHTVQRNPLRDYQSAGQDSCERGNDVAKNAETVQREVPNQPMSYQEDSSSISHTHHHHKRPLSWTTTTITNGNATVDCFSLGDYNISSTRIIIPQHPPASKYLLQDANNSVTSSTPSRQGDWKRARYREPRQEYDDEMSSSREDSHNFNSSNDTNSNNNINNNNNNDTDEFQSIESNPPSEFLSSGASDVGSTDAVAASESSFNPSSESDCSVNGDGSTTIQANFDNNNNNNNNNGLSTISVNQRGNEDNTDNESQQVSTTQQWLLWTKTSSHHPESTNLSVSSSTRTEISENIADVQERANRLSILSSSPTTPLPVIVMQAPDLHDQMEGLIHDWSLMHIRSLKRSAVDVRQARREMHRVLRKSNSNNT
jgi:hypothetical protein